MNDNLIQISRPSIGNPVPPPQKLESKYPTEVISLPSKGWFYPENSALSSGQIELKMMTAKEEDILTSKNLFSKNIVLDKLLEALVIDKNINLNEMFVCDRNAVFFAIRRLAYGDNYEAEMTCRKCGNKNSIIIDLSQMDNKEFEFSAYARGENNFSYVMPHSKAVVTFKMFTRKDEIMIEQEISGLSKVNKDISREVTTRLNYLITSVNGSSEKVDIRKFVDNLRSIDSLAFRTHVKNFLPELDSTFNFQCSECGYAGKEEVPMGLSFFWPERAV